LRSISKKTVLKNKNFAGLNDSRTRHRNRRGLIFGSTARQGFSAIVQAQDGISPLRLFDSGLKTPPLCAQVHTIPVRTMLQTGTRPLLCARRKSQLHPSKKNEGTCRWGSSLRRPWPEWPAPSCFISNYVLTRPYRKRGTRIGISRTGRIVGFLCGALKAQGFYTLSTACSTGLHAVGMASAWSRPGL